MTVTAEPSNASPPLPVTSLGCLFRPEVSDKVMKAVGRGRASKCFGNTMLIEGLLRNTNVLSLRGNVMPVSYQSRKLRR